MSDHPTIVPPVLLLVFRRPDTTRRVFEAVRLAQPPRLYVAADGPRDHRPEEHALCEQTRQIATAVDWPCEVRTLFRAQNLGCRVGVSMALDWFFEQESEGIILEDDCVPSASFFAYCAELLERFRDDERIMCISGDNFQDGRFVSRYSYYFSRYMHCWGWATWRRSWRLYDRDMTLWPEFRSGGGLGAWSDGQEGFEQYWQKIFDRAAAGEVDSWAYRFLFTCWAHNGLTCMPEKNLVSNIGHGGDATHTGDTESWHSALAAEELSFPIRHPPTIWRNAEADRFEHRTSFDVPKTLTLGQIVKRALPGPLVRMLKQLRTSR